MASMAKKLVESDRACLFAAAGCGKTEEISKAVALSTSGRQLVLTHTHAGVRSLRNRFRAMGIPPRQYHVDTIAGWALGCAAAYPTLSGLSDLTPTGDAWRDVYRAALELVKKPFYRKVLQASYDGIFVDEYQDCVSSQHKFIMALADALPCRVLCDPLQGIFDFQKDDPIVKWQTDIKPNFIRLPDLTTPWRWTNANNQLGKFLSNLRQALIQGKPIELRGSPIQWLPCTPNNQRKTCFELAQANEKSVVAIHRWSQSAHKFASTLKGLYTSMEEIECKDLMMWSERIEQAQRLSRPLAVIDFAAMCMTKVSSELRSVREQFSKEKKPQIKPNRKHLDIILALLEVVSRDDMSPVLESLQLISQINGTVLYRRELWYEMIRAIKAYQADGFDSLRDAAWATRDQARRFGRRTGDYRVVSRTLLVKGLEFDHVVVLDADQLDLKNLYVAMTRGSKSLTVLSKSPLITRGPFAEL
jgi:hypothetical protein